MKNDRAGSFERRVRLHCKFHNGGEIVSVYKAFCGRTMSERGTDAID
jgi:hypothetical protein